jgi:hypothetical protein
VLAFAPGISPRLLSALARIDEKQLSFAEVNRRLGAEAERLRLTRPSYQRVRELIHQLRRFRAGPSTAQVLWEVAWRVRPFEAVLDQVSGVGVPRLPP